MADPSAKLVTLNVPCGVTLQTQLSGVTVQVSCTTTPSGGGPPEDQDKPEPPTPHAGHVALLVDLRTLVDRVAAADEMEDADPQVFDVSDQATMVVEAVGERLTGVNQLVELVEPEDGPTADA
jgi:hypothetical protein